MYCVHTTLAMNTTPVRLAVRESFGAYRTVSSRAYQESAVKKSCQVKRNLAYYYIVLFLSPSKHVMLYKRISHM